MTEAPGQALAPMTIREAVECGKIFNAHASALRPSKDTLGLLNAIYQSMSGEHSIDLLRVMTLMEHESLDQIVEKYRVLGGHNMLIALAEHLRVNPLPDLLEMMAAFGIGERGWTDG